MYKSNRLSIYKDHVYVDPKRSHTDENAVSILYESIRICIQVFSFIYGGGVVMLCPFEAARTADFDFSQWFARIIFSCDFLDS